MSGEHGVDNLWKVVALGVEAGNVGDKMGRTKGMARYFHLTELFDEFVGLGSVNWDELKKEAGELDAADRAELNNRLKTKFDIADDKLEGVIEEAVEVAEYFYSGVTRAIGLYRKAKGLVVERKEADTAPSVEA